VRILAATNKDLDAEIKKGNFRKDLYYRLKVVLIEMPPLREIPEDIPLLANYFLNKHSQEMKKEPKKLSPGALRCLMNYAWPGNVRELENEMKRLVVLTTRKVITEDDLPETIQKSRSTLLTIGDSVRVTSRLMPARSLKEVVEELEKQMILKALQMCHQNQRQTAKALGLSRWGLIKKMKRYGIK